MAKETDVGSWRELRPALLDDALVLVPIPPLIAMLMNISEREGRDLTEAEVLGYRDNAVCMVMSRERAEKMAASRGYDDLNLDNVWPDWQALRAEGEAQAGESAA